MGIVRDFIFLGSKVTVDGDYSHEIKRYFVLRRKNYDQTRQHIKKQRHYSAIKRNTFESVLMKWMNLECIIQSEVSQEEKDKYCILTHI